MNNPVPGITEMSWAVIGYSVSSTVWADPPASRASQLIIQLILAGNNPLFGATPGVVEIDFSELGRDDPIGFFQIEEGAITALTRIALPLQEFGHYLAIMRHAQPAVVEFSVRQAAQGSIDWDIVRVNIAGGWGVAAPVDSELPR